MSRIKNLNSQLLTIGRVKIGELGERRQKRNGSGTFQLPKKIDHFKLTTNERGIDGNFKEDKKLTQEIKDIAGTLNENNQITSIPIRLMYNDPEINLFSRYNRYQGRECICYGDGIRNFFKKDGNLIEAENCPCDALIKKICKPSGTLRFIIDCSRSVGGCYQFKTTSWNSITSLYGSMDFIQTLTGGQLAFLPMNLIVQPSTAIVDGKSTTIYVVSIVYPGSIDRLQQEALSRIENNHQFLAQIESAERRAKQEEKRVWDEDDSEFAKEFFPEQAETEEAEENPDKHEETTPDKHEKNLAMYNPPTTHIPAPAPEIIKTEGNKISLKQAQTVKQLYKNLRKTGTVEFYMKHKEQFKTWPIWLQEDFSTKCERLEIDIENLNKNGSDTEPAEPKTTNWFEKFIDFKSADSWAADTIIHGYLIENQLASFKAIPREKFEKLCGDFENFINNKEYVQFLKYQKDDAVRAAQAFQSIITDRIISANQFAEINEEIRTMEAADNFG